MKLLVVADSAHTWPQDTEGRYTLQSLVQTFRPDALITLGDFSAVHATAMAHAGAPFTAGVYGNHCTQDYMPSNGIVDLIGDRTSPASRGTLRLTGHHAVSTLAVQGCVRYKPDVDDVLFTQAEYAAAIDSLGPAELVITHCPPAGVNDAEDPAHMGIDALRRWVDRYRPRWLIHGHTYDNPEVSRHGDTDVHYVHGHALITLPS